MTGTTIIQYIEHILQRAQTRLSSGDRRKEIMEFWKALRLKLLLKKKVMIELRRKQYTYMPTQHYCSFMEVPIFREPIKWAISRDERGIEREYRLSQVVKKNSQLPFEGWIYEERRTPRPVKTNFVWRP
jgi:hypothetical protein